MLTTRYRVARSEVACEHVQWWQHQWRTVLFTDESHFHVSTYNQLACGYLETTLVRGMCMATFSNMTDWALLRTV